MEQGNQKYFTIDFLTPGKSLVPEKGLLLAVHKLKGILQLLFIKQLYRRVSTSFTMLILGFVLLFSVSGAFYHQVYLPRQQSLKERAQEIKEVQAQVNSLRAKIEQQKTLINSRKKKLEQLKALKKVSLVWRDKLECLQHTMLDKLWLTFLRVNGEQGGQKPYGVVIKGATFSGQSKDKPLHLIANFINSLMALPSWHKTFDLKDWRINSDINKEKDGKEEKFVKFELELEGK